MHYKNVPNVDTLDSSREEKSVTTSFKFNFPVKVLCSCKTANSFKCPENIVHPIQLLWHRAKEKDLPAMAEFAVSINTAF